MTNPLISYQDRFEKLGIIVLIPVYNNYPKFIGLIDSVLEYTDNILIVNNGSADESQEVLEKYNQINILHIEKNRGRGAALLSGFNKAIEQGYQYAITIDPDAQNLSSDLTSFLGKIEEQPDALIIGARNMKMNDGIPGGSSFENKSSKFWFKVETGLTLPDIQSGFRLYPLDQIKNMRFYTRHCEFEKESLVRLSWQNVPILWLPIEVKYPDDSSSHTRNVMDLFRITLLNSVLVIIALFWIKPRDLYFKIKKGGFKKMIMSELLQSQDSNKKLALSIGFGFFMGILPVWGLQMIITVALAIPLKLNKAIALISANISLPPLIPFIIYLSFLVGGLILGGSALPEFSSDLSFDDVKDDLIQYYFGAVVLAIFTGISAGIISWFLLKKWRNENK